MKCITDMEKELCYLAWDKDNTHLEHFHPFSTQTWVLVLPQDYILLLYFHLLQHMFPTRGAVSWMKVSALQQMTIT